MSSSLTRIERRIHGRDVIIGPKVGQINPKWDKSGLVLDLSEPKHTEICSESPEFVPFGPSLGPNLVILIQRSVHPANAHSIAFCLTSVPYPSGICRLCDVDIRWSGDTNHSVWHQTCKIGVRSNTPDTEPSTNTLRYSFLMVEILVEIDHTTQVIDS